MKISYVKIFIKLTLTINCCVIYGNIQYYGQDRQDQFINEHIFKNKTNGIFVDVGAHDGITYSNTYFFERSLNWTGICIEPLPEIFQKLEKNRTATCYPVCAGNKNGTIDFLQIEGSFGNAEMLSGIFDQYDARHLDRINQAMGRFRGSSKIIQIQSRTLTSLLQENNITEVDFLSIDVEGGEKSVLEGLDLTLIKVKCMIIENNYRDTFNAIKDMLIAHGYLHFATTPLDEIFILPELLENIIPHNLPLQVCQPSNKKQNSNPMQQEVK